MTFVEDQTKSPLHATPDFQIIFEACPTPFLILTPTLHIVAVNQAYLDMTMTTREQMIGQHIFDIFPDNPGMTEKGTIPLRESLMRVIEDRIPDTMKLLRYDIRKTDGSFEARYWSPLNLPAFNSAGDIEYIIHYAEDVTDYAAIKSPDLIDVNDTEYLVHRHSQEMAATNEALRQVTLENKKRYEKNSEIHQARLRAVVNHAIDGLITINQRGIVETFNPACERVFGYKEQEVIGKNIKILMPEPYHSEHETYLHHHVLTGEAKIIGTAGREVSGRRKDGSVFPMDLSVSSFELDDGKHFSGIIRDITERRKAEAEREVMIAKLTQSNSDLEQFAHIVAHDLKSPLRAVSQHLELIYKKNASQLDEKSACSLNFAVDGAHRMQALIDALFDYAKFSFTAPEFERVNLNHILNGTLRDLAPVIEDTKAIISSETLPEIDGDPILLAQLLQNLIANAMKYCKSTPIVHIKAEKYDTDYWEISVCDNGIGIEPWQYQQIFSIFRRLHHAEEYPGIGLGLAICDRIVKQHEGRISVESEVGKGSRFYFILPSVQRKHIPHRKAA